MSRDDKTQTRFVLLYGELPEPGYILTWGGLRWNTAMLAARRLVKRLCGVPNHRAAPYWSVDYADGSEPFQVYEFNHEIQEFVQK